MTTKGAVAVLMLPLAGLTNPATAQETLPWRLANYPSGGAAFSRIVAEPLTGDSELLVPTCRALEPGNVEQTASGFAGIGIAIANSSESISAELVSQLPECCPTLIEPDADTRILRGAQLALLAREIGETDINSGRGINQLIDICGDDILRSSYDVALGEDTLGQLIAQEGGNGPPTTGSIDTGSGGGIPSPN